MPRNYKPKPGAKTYKKYDKQIIEKALEELAKSDSSLGAIANKFGISKSVLYRHKLKDMKSHGGQTALSAEAENCIVQYLNTYYADYDYPLTPMNLRYIVKMYLDAENVNHKRFKDNLPGQDFAYGFLKRQKDKISKQICKEKKLSKVNTISNIKLPLSLPKIKKRSETASPPPENNVLPSQDQQEYIISHDEEIPVTGKDGFSWQCEPSQKLQDEGEQCDDVPDNLSLYCDDNAVTETTNEISGKDLHEGFQCDSCNGDVVGFRYTCVQCNNFDLCVACESGGAHAQHYVLRVPEPRPFNEIQTVLKKIRRYLLKKLDPISTDNLDEGDAVSTRYEVKSEIEDEDDDEVQEFEDNRAVDILNYDFNQDSNLSSIGFVTLTDKESEELSQNNKSIQQNVNITNPNCMKLTKNIKLIPMREVNKDHLLYSSVQKNVKILSTSDEKQQKKQRPVVIRRLNKNVVQKQLNSPIQHRGKNSNMTRELNQSPFIRTSDESRSTPAGAAKRRIVFDFAEFLKQEESDQGVYL